MTKQQMNSQLHAERITRANRLHRHLQSVSILTAALCAAALVTYAGLPIIVA